MNNYKVKRPAISDRSLSAKEHGMSVSRVLLGTIETAPVRYLSGTTVAGTPQATCAALPGRQCTMEYHHTGRCGVAPDRVYICTQLPAMPVSFYLAFPSVPKDPKISQSPPRSPGSRKDSGSLFLLHFPGSFLRRTLSVILPCGARTFLMPIPFGAMARNGQAYPA